MKKLLALVLLAATLGGCAVYPVAPARVVVEPAPYGYGYYHYYRY